VSELMLQVAEGYRRPLPESWPPELKGIVTACMAQQPRDRPSADQACALNPVSSKPGTTPTPAVTSACGTAPAPTWCVHLKLTWHSARAAPELMWSVCLQSTMQSADACSLGRGSVLGAKCSSAWPAQPVCKEGLMDTVVEASEADMPACAPLSAARGAAAEPAAGSGNNGNGRSGDAAPARRRRLLLGAVTADTAAAPGACRIASPHPLGKSVRLLGNLC